VVAELEVVESGVAALWKRVGALDGGEGANEPEADWGMLIYALCQLLCQQLWQLDVEIPIVVVVIWRERERECVDDRLPFLSGKGVEVSLGWRCQDLSRVRSTPYLA
jgi:hypothetical protein